MAVDDTMGVRIPPAHEVLIPESDSVEVEGIDPKLLLLAVELGYIHFILFGSPLIIKGAGLHVPAAQTVAAPVHFLYLRIDDLTIGERLAFLVVVHFAAYHNGCTVATERGDTPEGELRLEYYG